MSNVSQVLAVAQNEIGYLEKASNSLLTDKIANAGSGNFTKYWASMSPGLQGQAWCQCWINYIFKTAYGDATAKQMLYSPSTWSYYTPTAASYFINNKAWFHSPKIGDIVYFHNGTRICHVGLIYNVDNSYIYTVEGNTTNKADTVVPNGGGVFAKKYLKTNSSISGYGRPRYAEDPIIPVIKEEPIKGFFGVDVSSYQGDIDWNLAKNEIKFAFLRSIVKNGSVDTSFEKNFNGCKIAGIKVGVYKFSYALTETESIKEAQAVLNLLKGRKIDCGIWLDLEWSTQRALGKTAVNNIAKAFLNTIESAGYKVGIYCNKDWYENVIDKSVLGKYKFWIARYPKDDNGTVKTSLKLDYATIWQFSSKGRISGINGNVDKNLTEIEFWNEMAGSGTIIPPQPSISVSVEPKPVSTPEPAPASMFNVKVVQRQLSINYGLQLSETGVFDKATKKAITKAYQTELNKFGYGLVVDGEFGKLTSAAYANTVKFQMANSVGVFTALWQMILICYGYTTVAINGVFDTETAVHTGLLQRKLGLLENYLVDFSVVQKSLS